MKKRLIIAALLLALFVPLGLLWNSCTPSPLPSPPPFQGELPPASPPKEMAVFQIPTGVIHRSAGFAYRGGSWKDKREFAAAAVLVRHPRGDLLIDAGFSRDIDAQIRRLPTYWTWVMPYAKTRSAAEQLDAAGYDRKKLRGILLTHGHWDHGSGIADFANVPVFVNAEERRYVELGGEVTALVRNISAVRYEEYDFAGGPYLGFAKSHDVYGDGSIVIVPTPGHTPGSVIIFLTLPEQTRYAMVGDLVWQREGISLRAEKPWPQRALVDKDFRGVREHLLHMAAIANRFPQIHIVPAHDARGFAEMPELSAMR